MLNVVKEVKPGSIERHGQIKSRWRAGSYRKGLPSPLKAWLGEVVESQHPNADNLRDKSECRRRPIQLRTTLVLRCAKLISQGLRGGSEATIGPVLPYFKLDRAKP